MSEENFSAHIFLSSPVPWSSSVLHLSETSKSLREKSCSGTWEKTATPSRRVTEVSEAAEVRTFHFFVVGLECWFSNALNVGSMSKRTTSKLFRMDSAPGPQTILNGKRFL